MVEIGTESTEKTKTLTTKSVEEKQEFSNSFNFSNPTTIGNKIDGNDTIGLELTLHKVQTIWFYSSVLAHATA